MKNFLIPVFAFFVLAVTAGWVPAHAADSPPAAADSKADGDKKDDATASKDGEKPKSGEDAPKKKGPTDVTGGRFAGDPVYVHLPPMTLPILGNTGPEQLVTLQITVQVKDFDAGDDIHSNMPRVMDALMRALYGGLDSGTLRNGRVVDVNKVKMRATTALQNVLGIDNVKDVLIVNMSQRLL